MVSTAAMVLGLIALVLAFGLPVVAWIPYSLPATYLLVNLWSMRQLKAKAIPDLSPAANALLARYPYWYQTPFVAKDCSRAAGFLAILAIVLGIIGYFRGSPWTLVPGFLAFVAMSAGSRGFDPISRVSDEESRKAHDEIVSYLIHGRR